jgi:DNA-binding NarL/FixJ family response regulator
MPPDTILIADDHTLFREGVRSICENLGNFQVIGEARNGHEAVSMAKDLKPDIILMDINMPKLDGVQATRQIIKNNPLSRVVMLTIFDEDNYLFDAIKAGARGYILKDTSSEKFLAGIRAVLDGEITLPKTMALKVFDEFRLISQGPRNPEDTNRLTPGEMDVLQGIAQGMENRNIALSLGISEKTVSNRLSEIFSKLRVSNRTQAALLAIRRGWASLYPDPGT